MSGYPMSRRLEAMRRRAFEEAFLTYRNEGCSEETAIDLAEREAQEMLDRYCDEKIHERKEGGQ